MNAFASAKTSLGPATSSAWTPSWITRATFSAGTGLLPFGANRRALVLNRRLAVIESRGAQRQIETVGAHRPAPRRSNDHQANPVACRFAPRGVVSKRNL